MADVTLLNTLASSGFDARSLVGLSGAPTIESFVNYLKDQWRLTPRLAPIASMLAAISLNMGLGILFNSGIYSSLVTGLCTGFLASGWYELTRQQVQAQQTNTTVVK